MFKIFLVNFSEIQGRGSRDFKNGKGEGYLRKDSARDGTIENSNFCRKAGVFCTPPFNVRNLGGSCSELSVSFWVWDLWTLGNWLGVTDNLLKFITQECPLLFPILFSYSYFHRKQG